MSKTCDWCGEMEPESGAFKRTDEGIRSMRTVLCPECCPDEDVERGIFIVYSFTADREENHVVEAVTNYIGESINAAKSFKLIQDVGVSASVDGHSRYELVMDVNSGLSHYRMNSLLKMEAVIDSATGDPERNNCRAKFYNYKVDDVLKSADQPEIVYDSEAE